MIGRSEGNLLSRLPAGLQLLKSKERFWKPTFCIVRHCLATATKCLLDRECAQTLYCAQNCMLDNVNTWNKVILGLTRNHSCVNPKIQSKFWISNPPCKMD